VAEALNLAGVESRAGCHCATLAHHALHLDPPASCRLSFYFYNTLDEVDQSGGRGGRRGKGESGHRGRVSRNPPNGQEAVADALMASGETAS
jgi:hypothetical protein